MPVEKIEEGGTYGVFNSVPSDNKEFETKSSTSNTPNERDYYERGYSEGYGKGYLDGSNDAKSNTTNVETFPKDGFVMEDWMMMWSIVFEKDDDATEFMVIAPTLEKAVAIIRKKYPDGEIASINKV